MAKIENPILLDLPEGFETERLILRPPRIGDGDVIYAAVEASRAELRPWMPWADQDRKATEIYIRKSVAQWILREFLPLTIWRKSDGAFIGNSGAHDFDWDVPSLELGYWQDTRHAGNGYIAEAVNGQVAFFRKHLHVLAIEIWCDARNLKSAGVAERCGFQRYSHNINGDRDRFGNLRDWYGYSKTWREDEP